MTWMSNRSGQGMVSAKTHSLARLGVALAENAARIQARSASKCVLRTDKPRVSARYYQKCATSKTRASCLYGLLETVASGGLLNQAAQRFRLLVGAHMHRSGIRNGELLKTQHQGGPARWQMRRRRAARISAAD